MNITNGTVTYGRTTKPADFESKKAEVVLSFAAEEGATAVVAAVAAVAIAKVFDMAVAEVHRRLGLNSDDLVHAEVRAVANPNDIDATLSTGRTKRAKAPPAEVKPATDEEWAAVVLPDPALVKPPSDPAAIEEPADVPEAVIEDEAVITDKDLHAGVHLAMERHVSNKAIKDLVVKFTGGVAGKSMTLIQQRARQDFLAALKAL